MSTGDELALLRSRLDRLERRCGWLPFERWFWRCGFLVTLGILGYLILLESGYRGLSIPHILNCDTITCNAVLTHGVLVNNKEGERRAVLGIADNGIVSLSLWSSDDKILVALGAHDKGGVAKFLDREGKANVWTGFYSGGEAGIHIEDAKGTKRAQLAMLQNKPQFNLWDENGKGQVWTGFYNDGGSGFHIEDAKGVRRANLTFIKDKPQIYLNDEAGKTTFSTT